MDEIRFPENGLTEYAVEIPHGSFETMQKVVAFWKDKGMSESYMALQVNDEAVQLVPYVKSSGILGQMWQQLQVLWRFVFGGYRLTPDRVQHLKETYMDLEGGQTTSKVEDAFRCAFCSSQVIESQKVLSGERMQVLYNYAPIGLGGERLHFLIVSKRHCPRFDQLTPHEYEEAQQLVATLVERLKGHYQEVPIQNIYIYHKTGEDAGQSVPHWHIHVVITQTKAEEWWGKLTVLRNILFGSFRLSPEALENQRQKYFKILN